MGSSWKDWVDAALEIGKFIPGPQQPFVIAADMGYDTYQGVSGDNKRDKGTVGKIGDLAGLIPSPGGSGAGAGGGGDFSQIINTALSAFGGGGGSPSFSSFAQDPEIGGGFGQSSPPIGSEGATKLPFDFSSILQNFGTAGQQQQQQTQQQPVQQPARQYIPANINFSQPTSVGDLISSALSKTRRAF